MTSKIGRPGYTPEQKADIINEYERLPYGKKFLLAERLELGYMSLIAMICKWRKELRGGEADVNSTDST